MIILYVTSTDRPKYVTVYDVEHHLAVDIN